MSFESLEQPTGPTIDAGKFVMHVDTLGVIITLGLPTQARHLRARLPVEWAGNTGKPPYARPIGADASGTASQFEILIQDPSVVSQLRAQIASIPNVIDVQITQLDVALDWYPEDQSDKPAMVAVLARMIGGITKLDNRIRTKNTTSSRSIILKDDLLSAISAGDTAYRGNPKPFQDKPADTVYARAYCKFDENGNRARLELTMTGPDLPAKTLDELDDFDWRSLSKYFIFRIKDPSIPTNAIFPWQLATSGRHHFRFSDTSRDNHRRVYPKGTIADRELSDAARLALRKLDRQRRRPAL